MKEEIGTIFSKNAGIIHQSDMKTLTTFAQRLIFPALVFCGFCIALPPFFKSISIMLLTLILLASGELFRCKYTVKQIFDLRNPLFWLATLYILYCIGMLWSSNTAYGLMDLQIKLPLILIPFLFCFVPREHLTKKRLWIYASAFITGITIVLSYLLISAILRSMQSETFNFRHIMYIYLSANYAPNYLATETCIATILTFFNPLKFLRISNKGVIIIKSCLICFFNTLLILLDSRVGSIGIAVADLIILFHLFRKRNILLAFLFMAYVIGNVAFVGTMARMPFERSIPKSASNSSESRLTIYYYVLNKSIMNSPVWGYGTGDTRDALTKTYSDEQIGFKRYLNAHNQFLQTTVAIGVLGLACLVAVFVCFALRLWERKYFALLAGLAIIGLLMMTESSLERQAGVHFCSFAFCWLYAISCKNKKKERIEQV